MSWRWWTELNLSWEIPGERTTRGVPVRGAVVQKLRARREPGASRKPQLGHSGT